MGAWEAACTATKCGIFSIHPKAIARELWEGFLSFEDYVRRYGIARMEGVLLRYLSQVHSTLARNLPESARNDEILELIGFLRAMIARVDSSLVEEWESLVSPSEAHGPTDEVIPDRAPRRLDRKRFEVARRQRRSDFFAHAASAVTPPPPPAWTWRPTSRTRWYCGA